jgi:protein-S-isoprenylcysteine O-methyltransferase Ste14
VANSRRLNVNGNNSKLTTLLLVFLALVFTVGLTFATLEAPRVLHRVVARFIDIPDFHPAIEPEVIEEWMNSHHVRTIGYVCLALLILLIIVGFVTERTGLSSLGTLAFFLPTFGYFAAYMFFLGGIGILRLLWLPIWGPSKILLKLGDIAYLPYMALVYPFALIGVDIRAHLARILIGLGLFVFLLGTIAWFHAKLQRKETVDFWLYRYSRHPQYLGWIMWSYGMMLLAARVPVPLAGENPGASLPWVISSLLVICVALSEEIKMSRERGQEYTVYRASTPFMLPLPRIVSNVITAPMRMLFKTGRPENRKQILATFVVYAVILIVLSLPFVLLNWPPGPNGWFDWPYRGWPFHTPPPRPTRPPPPA